MSSFTPFFDSSFSLFAANLLAWRQFVAWSSHSYQILELKKKYSEEEKILQQFFCEERAQPLAEFTSIGDKQHPKKLMDGLKIKERKSHGRIQCKGRNDYSNILKAFINLIKVHPVFKEKIKSVISNRSLPITYEKFLIRIRRKFSKGKTYVSPKQILTFIKACNKSLDQGQKAIGILFRIILKNFLSIEYILCLIKSFKGKKQSRKDLITKTRQLNRTIFDNSPCEEQF